MSAAGGDTGGSGLASTESSGSSMTTPSTDSPAPASTASRPREPLGRRILWLTLATLAVLTFIVWQSDLRRKRQALHAAKRYVQAVAQRVASPPELPLDLSPPAQAKTPLLDRLMWIDPDEARRLRAVKEPVLVAYTRPIRQVLGTDGRAVVFFEGGRLAARWLTEIEFRQRLARQRKRLEPRKDPGSPG